MTTTTEILEDLRKWVELETPTSEPAALNRLMDIIAARYRSIGGRVDRVPGRDGYGDHLSITMPWGQGAADQPGVLVLCHVDTVHPLGTLETMPFRIEGDRVWGPGILDMKGGGCIALHALTQIAAGNPPPLPVRVLVTSDEEVGSPTARALIEEAGRAAKYVLVPEPARDGGKIVTGRRGVGRYGISTHGRAAHSGVAHPAGRSAIAEMARQVLAIEAMTDYDRGITLNVGKIQGGSADNTVPEWCHARIDLRADTDEGAREIHDRLLALAPQGPDVTVKVEGGINRPPYQKTPAIAALYERAKGLAAEIGFELQDMHTGGGSDGSFLAASVPTLDGLGVDGHGAHTLDEHLYVSSLEPRMTLLRRLIETLD